MTFDASTTGTLLVVALAAAGVLLIAVVVQFVQLGRLRGNYRDAVGDGTDVFAAIRQHGQDLEAVRKDVGTVHRNTEKLRELLKGATSRVAVVRYDAFEDMGGAMSFSAAMLDEHDNGIVLTSINGRAETRTYAKPIVNGSSEHNLSEDEKRAIAAAKAGQREVFGDDGPSVRIRRKKVVSGP